MGKKKKKNPKKFQGEKRYLRDSLLKDGDARGGICVGGRKGSEKEENQGYEKRKKCKKKYEGGKDGRRERGLGKKKSQNQA